MIKLPKHVLQAGRTYVRGKNGYEKLDGKITVAESPDGLKLQ